MFDVDSDLEYLEKLEDIEFLYKLLNKYIKELERLNKQINKILEIIEK